MVTNLAGGKNAAGPPFDYGTSPWVWALGSVETAMPVFKPLTPHGPKKSFSASTDDFATRRLSAGTKNRATQLFHKTNLH